MFAYILNNWVYKSAAVSYLLMITAAILTSSFWWKTHHNILWVLTTIFVINLWHVLWSSYNVMTYVVRWSYDVCCDRFFRHCLWVWPQITPVWVPGLRIDPLRLMAGYHKRRLNHAPLNLRGLIWLLMMVWSKRGNINTAAVDTIAQCNTLVARCSRQLIGPADWVFVTLGPLRCD